MKVPSYSPATATDDTWCRQPAPIVPASSTTRAGAVDVRRAVGVVVGGDVVDRAEVQDVVDLAGEPVDLGVVQAEARAREVADDGDDLLVALDVGEAAQQPVA